jgi:hypothetical protein
MKRKDREQIRKNSDMPVGAYPPDRTPQPANGFDAGPSQTVGGFTGMPALGLPRTEPNAIDYREIGASGLKRFSGFIYEEFLTELTGWKGIQVYKEMALNDATVGAVLFAISMLCRRVKWFTEPASTQPEDTEAAEFLETCMNDMSHTWIDQIAEILTMLPYGFSAHEIVYKRRCGDVLDPSMRSKYADGRIGWRKIPIRSQDTIYRWQFDDHGGIQGLEQLAPPHYYHVTIPVEKMLLFRTTVERNNPEGKSVLRNAYRSWYMKKNIENIEAIGIERDLAGLPIAYVPTELLSLNASNDQKNLLGAIRDIVVNIRRNAQEGMVFPLMYNAEGKPVYDLKLLSTGGQRQFDTSKIIDRYDQRMAMTVLADFILLGSDKVGSFALASSKTNLFSTAIGAFLDIIADVFNRYAVPRLFAFNDFDITDFPQIKHGDLGSVDLNELGQFIQRLAQSGMPLFPNVDLEKHLLEIAGMPAPAETEMTEVPIADNLSAMGEETPEEIPAMPFQTPSEDGRPNDNSPVDGKPPVETATTNLSGNTERTSRAVGDSPSQEYDERLGPKA